MQPRCVPSTPHFARLVWWWTGHADCHARLIFVGAGRPAQYVQCTCISIQSNHTPPNPTHPIQNTHTTQAPAPASSTWRPCRWAGGSVTRTSPSPCWRRASWVGGVFVICIYIRGCVCNTGSTSSTTGRTYIHIRIYVYTPINTTPAHRRRPHAPAQPRGDGVPGGGGASLPARDARGQTGDLRGGYEERGI